MRAKSVASVVSFSSSGLITCQTSARAGWAVRTSRKDNLMIGARRTAARAGRQSTHLITSRAGMCSTLYSRCFSVSGRELDQRALLDECDRPPPARVRAIRRKSARGRCTNGAPPTEVLAPLDSRRVLAVNAGPPCCGVVW
eukprot:4063617-Prymnesium_polylepis.1